MDAKLRKLIAHEGSCLKLAPSGSKVLCTLTGHELALQYDTIHTFIKGRKYQRLKAAAEAKEALRKYEPFLVQSRNFEDKLYCALTCQLLGKSLDAVRQHMGGKKFQRAKERYQNDELELMEEPSLRDSPPHAEAAAPMEGQEGPGSSTAAATATDVSGSSAGPDADGLWVPDEYVEMEAQAATQAAEAVQLDASPPEAGGGEEPPAAAGTPAKNDGHLTNGTGPSSASRRPKRAKPKHKAKKARLT